MRKWEKAVKRFLTKWEERDDVVGAIVCGSYITGKPSSHSDIDIQIILAPDADWRERGNEIVDGFLIEYFANPALKHEEYTLEDYKTRKRINAHMFCTGKIAFDKNGDLQKLIKFSRRYISRRYKAMKHAQVEIAKYHLWDMQDNLEEVHESGREEFFFVLFNSLRNLLEVYSGYLGYESVPINKIGFLYDRKERNKYLIPEFPDRVFAKAYCQAMKIKNRRTMMSDYRQLTSYVLNQMGGFKIDGWKIKTPLN